MIKRFILNYLPRHRNRLNQALHLIGVPLTFIGTPVCLATEMAGYWAVACFVGGYVLQFAGHAVEGNDAGEAVFVKRMLGMSYREYGPCAEHSSNADQRDDRTSG